MIAEIERYWNARIHDLEMTQQPVGSRAFFEDLDAYRFDKLHYLPRLVDFNGYAGRELLEVGCGIGTDLVRFARGGAIVTGVDLSTTAIDLARKNFDWNGVHRQGAAHGKRRGAAVSRCAHSMLCMDTACCSTPPTRRASCRSVIACFAREARPSSWSTTACRGSTRCRSSPRSPLEHEDAPVLKKYSIAGVPPAARACFADVEVVPERFPVKSRLHRGWKGVLFNTLFVGGFNTLPRAWVRPLGWHLMAFCRR